MTAVAHLNALYSAARVVLWVEDGLTRDYLTRLWADPEIAFLIAGNAPAITPTVRAAEREGIHHVFGLVDRDFGHTNVSAWASSATRVFYLPRHETENYALDADALSGCVLNNRGRSAADVQAQLGALASGQPSWLACRRVLTEIRQDTHGDFPGHPPVGAIPSLREAEQHITSSSWFGQLAARAARWQRPGAVSAALHAAEAVYQSALQNGTWLADFSGKELFRRIRDSVYQPPAKPGRPDSDFAQAVGDWQRAHGAIPGDLTQLRSALRVRVGLSP